MHSKKEGFFLWQYLLFALAAVAVFLLCVCLGSVTVPFPEVLRAMQSIFIQPDAMPASANIIFSVRIPRVISVALVGAALSICGAAMQGLLRNPLADGSTLGVSAGASLGAVVAITMGLYIPWFPSQSTAVFSVIFAFISLICILALAHRLDFSLSTNTIILIGVIFSMFSNSIISLLVTFADEKIKSIVFWTMGSFAGASYVQAAWLFACLLVCGGIIIKYSRELNAFAVGEENAHHVGIHVRQVKLTVLIAVSVLIGVCVSVSGTIGFVGLVIPHIIRMLTGPNHKRLLPASLFGGAIFLMIADLAARVVLRPRELPVGVVTSIVGAALFLYIFYTTRKDF